MHRYATLIAMSQAWNAYLHMLIICVSIRMYVSLYIHLCNAPAEENQNFQAFYFYDPPSFVCTDISMYK